MSASAEFDVRWELRDDRTAVVTIDGDIDLATAPRVAAVLPDVAAAGATRVVIDLDRVPFLDSSGLSVLINAQRRLTRAGGRLVLACSHRAVLRPIELTRLDSTFEIAPTREQALERLEQRPQLGPRRPAGAGEGSVEGA